MANECKILNLIEQKSFWQNIIEFDEKFEFVKKLGQGEYFLNYDLTFFSLRGIVVA